jgi:nicotinamidase-related amidase
MLKKMERVAVIVVDMLNDFVTGVLRAERARAQDRTAKEAV